MEYNKNQFQKANSKKVLHKIKKHWVVISMSLLMALGGGLTATHASAQADQTNNNHDHDQTTGKAEMRSRINSSLKTMQDNSNQSTKQAKASQKPVNNDNINQAANSLHQRIIQNSLQGRNNAGQNDLNYKINAQNNVKGIQKVGSNRLNNASRIPGVEANVGSANQSANQVDVNRQKKQNPIAKAVNANVDQLRGESNDGTSAFTVKYVDASDDPTGMNVMSDKPFNSDSTINYPGQNLPSINSNIQNIPVGGYQLKGVYYNGKYISAEHFNFSQPRDPYYVNNEVSDGSGGTLNIPTKYSAAGTSNTVYVEVVPSKNNGQGTYKIQYEDADNGDEIVQTKSTSDSLDPNYDANGSFDINSYATNIPQGYTFKDLQWNGFTYNSLPNVKNSIATDGLQHQLPTYYVKGTTTIKVEVTKSNNNAGLVTGNINYIDASDGDTLLDQQPVTGSEGSTLKVSDFDDLAPLGYTATNSDQANTRSNWKDQLNTGLSDDVYVTKASVTPSPRMPMNGYSHINIEYMNGSSKVDSDNLMGKINTLLSNGSSYLSNLPNGYKLNVSSNSFNMPPRDQNMYNYYLRHHNLQHGPLWAHYQQEAKEAAAGNQLNLLSNQLENAKYPASNTYTIQIPVKISGSGPSADHASTDNVQYVDMSTSGNPVVGNRSITGKTNSPINWGPLINFVPSGYEYNSIGSHDNYYQDGRTDVIYVQKSSNAAPTTTKGVININYVASDGTPLGNNSLLQSDGQSFNIAPYKANLPANTQFDSVENNGSGVPTSFIANQTQNVTIKVDRLGTINVYYMNGNGVISKKSVTGLNGHNFNMTDSGQNAGDFSADTTAGIVNGIVPENYSFDNIAIGGNINQFNTGAQSVIVNVRKTHNYTAPVSYQIAFHDVSDTSNPDSTVGNPITVNNQQPGTPIQYINYLSQIPNGYKYAGLGADDDNVAENNETNVIDIKKSSNSSNVNPTPNPTPDASHGVINIMYKDSDGSILGSKSLLESTNSLNPTPFNINNYDNDLPANTEFDKNEANDPTQFEANQTQNAYIDVDRIGTINVYYLNGSNIVGKYSHDSVAGNSINEKNLVSSEIPYGYQNPSIIEGNGINAYKVGTQDIMVSVNGKDPSNAPRLGQDASNDEVIYLNESNHDQQVGSATLSGKVGDMIDYGKYLVNPSAGYLPDGYKFVRMGNYASTYEDNGTNVIYVETTQDADNKVHPKHPGSNPSGNGSNTNHNVPTDEDGAINVDFVTSDGTLVKNDALEQPNNTSFNPTEYGQDHLPDGTTFVTVLNGQNVTSYKKNTLQDVEIEVHKAIPNATVNVHYVDVNGGAVLKRDQITGQSNTQINYAPLTNASHIPAGYNFVGYGTLVPDYKDGATEDILVKPSVAPQPSDNTGVINVVYKDGDNNEISSYATTGSNGSNFNAALYTQPGEGSKIPTGYHITGYVPNEPSAYNNQDQDYIISVAKDSPAAPVTNGTATIKIVDPSDDSNPNTNHQYTVNGANGSLINYNNYESNVPNGYHVTSVIGDTHLENGDVNTIYIAKDTAPNTSKAIIGHVKVIYHDVSKGDTSADGNNIVNTEEVDGPSGSLFNLSPYANNIPQSIDSGGKHINYSFSKIMSGANVDQFDDGTKTVNIAVKPVVPVDPDSTITIHYRLAGAGNAGQPDVSHEVVSGLTNSNFNPGLYEHNLPQGFKFVSAPGLDDISNFPSNGGTNQSTTVYILPD